MEICDCGLSAFVQGKLRSLQKNIEKQFERLARASCFGSGITYW